MGWRTSSDKPMSMFEQRLTLLKWFLAEKQEKQRLVVFEYPELYASEKQMNMLEEIIYRCAENATYFIIVSGYDFNISLEKNIIINDNPANSYILGLLYDITEDKMPFVFSESEYTMAVKIILNNWHREELMYKNINSLPVKSAYIAAFLGKILGAVLDVSYIENTEISKYINSI